MIAKNILSFALILGFLAINISVGCSEKQDVQVPDGFQSLIGKWQAKRSIYNITKKDGTTFQSVTEIDPKSTSIIWQFFADGRLVVSNNGVSDQLRWSLKVNTTNLKDIETGKLTIIGGSTKSFAESIGQTGDLVYDISTSKIDGVVTVMSLDIDVTKIGPYKKNILASIYEKL